MTKRLSLGEGYVAFVPALPSCHFQGDTLGELMDDVKEAMELYLETLAAKRFLKLRHIFKKRDVNV